MENLQLHGAVACTAGAATYTLFIACCGGRYGVVLAGDWETVLPFRFDEIRALADGNLAVLSAGRRTIYRPVAGRAGCRLVPVRPRRNCRRRLGRSA